MANRNPTRSIASHRAPFTTSKASNGEGDKASSGFVLKLYEMVNGAPDDILAWVSDGEAFRISDLARLEAETLPSYFRHSRFQSLVRQLNFYSFRKVNRERTFWVYQHPLFHRDHPQELKKLRRRTCAAFDGRKQKLSSAQESSTNSSSVSSSYSNEKDDIDQETLFGVDGEPVLVSPELMTGPKVSRSPSPTSSQAAYYDRSSAGRGSLRIASLKSSISVEDNTRLRGEFFRTVSPSSYDSKSARDGSTQSMVGCDNVTSIKFTEEVPEEHQSYMDNVVEVARNLNVICSEMTTTPSSNQHPRGRVRGSRSGDGTANLNNSVSNMYFGLEKPESHYSRIKCDLLTYDDEYDASLEAEADEPTCALQESTSRNFTRGEYQVPLLKSQFKILEDIPPSKDEKIIASITCACREGYLCNSFSSVIERSLSSEVLMFFLVTHPQDPNISVKIPSFLKSHPSLSEEFEAYCTALYHGASGPEVVRDWVTFSSNHIHRLLMAINCNDPNEARFKQGVNLSAEELGVIKNVWRLWFS